MKSNETYSVPTWKAVLKIPESATNGQVLRIFRTRYSNRKPRHYDAEVFARDFGLTRKELLNMERDLHPIPKNLAKKFAKVFNTSYLVFLQ